MYVVIVRHNTGHGKDTDVILCTENLDLALSTVNNIDELDYEFYSDNCYIAITKMDLERIYLKKEFKYFIDSVPFDCPVVLFNRWIDNIWVKELEIY